MNKIQSFFVAIIIVFSASCNDSTHKYCRSSEAAALGSSIDADKFRNVNSHFKQSRFDNYEITVAPTHQGCKIVVVSSEKIDELTFNTITDEAIKQLSE
jgi:hypothetical protein